PSRVSPPRPPPPRPHPPPAPPPPQHPRPPPPPPPPATPGLPRYCRKATPAGSDHGPPGVCCPYPACPPWCRPAARHAERAREQTMPVTPPRRRPPADGERLASRVRHGGTGAAVHPMPATGTWLPPPARHWIRAGTGSPGRKTNHAYRFDRSASASFSLTFFISLRCWRTCLLSWAACSSFALAASSARAGSAAAPLGASASSSALVSARSCFLALSNCGYRGSMSIRVRASTADTRVRANHLGS